MIVLAILSIIAIYIFVERFIAIRAAEKDDPLFMDRIRDYLKGGDVKSAINFCRVTNTPGARLIERGISRMNQAAPEIQTAIENTGNLEVAALEKRNERAGKTLYRMTTVCIREGMTGSLEVMQNCLNAIPKLADAEFIFVNEVSYFLSSLPIRSGTTVIQTWHACGAFKKFGYSAEQITQLMDDMVKQGDQGAFTFGEFAKAGSAVISAYSPIGTAPEDIKKANAAMQIIMKGTKSAEIAVTALGSAMSELSSPDKQQKLMAIGVRVRDESGKFRDFNDIMADLLKVSEKVGNTDFLGNIFGQTSMQAIRAYSNFYEDMYPKLMDLGDTTGAMENKSATMANTLAANLQQVQTAFVRFADAKLTEPLEKLTNLLNKLAEDPDAFNRIFTGIAVGIGSIAAVKGLSSVINIVSSISSLKKGGGNINIGSNLGGAGMPVYVTNWGGKAGASPFPSSGSAGNQQALGRTPAGQAAGTPLNAGSQGNTLQKMGGAANQAVKGLTGKQLAAGGAAAGIGAALVAIPSAVNEVAEINADETLTDKEKSTKKGGAIGDAAGTVIGATAGGVAGVAAGAAVGAAVGSVIPVLGTAVGALVGAGIGALGGWLGGKAGRAIGEGIGSAVAGDDEEHLSETLEDQLPADTIPVETLPPEITNQYMSGEPKYSGVQTTANLEGEVAMKVDIDITNKTPTVNAEFIRNTTGGRVMPELGSAKTARETL